MYSSSASLISFADTHRLLQTFTFLKAPLSLLENGSANFLFHWESRNYQKRIFLNSSIALPSPIQRHLFLLLALLLSPLPSLQFTQISTLDSTLFFSLLGACAVSIISSFLLVLVLSLEAGWSHTHLKNEMPKHLLLTLILCYLRPIFSFSS